MAANLRTDVHAAQETPSHDDDCSPLDFSKRALPARLNLEDETPIPGLPARRMSLLSDALRSPPLLQECARTTNETTCWSPGWTPGWTPGILKNTETDIQHQSESRPAGQTTRTHFVEPVKPCRTERSSTSRTKSAPVSPQLHKSELPNEVRRSSVTFLEPVARPRSTSPHSKMRSQKALFNTSVFTDEDVCESVSSPSGSPVGRNEKHDKYPGSQEDQSGDIDEDDNQDLEEEDETSDDYEKDESEQSNDEDDEEEEQQAQILREQSAAKMGCSPRIKKSRISDPASLSHLVKRRALSFSDNNRQEGPKPESLPRRRSLAFAESPFHRKEHENLLRLHRRHAKRCMTRSPMLSSASSQTTNLFDTPRLSSSYDSSEMECDVDELKHELSQIQVCSPHLVKLRAPSPKPQDLGSPEDDSDEELEEEEQSDSSDTHDDSSEGDESDDDGDDSEDVVADEIDDPIAQVKDGKPISHSTADTSDETTVGMDQCAVWASQSISSENDCSRSFVLESSLNEPIHQHSLAHRRQIQRRTSALHTLMLTEPSMQYAGSSSEQLDKTDELALAAELLLLHKSPEVEEENTSGPTVPSVCFTSDDEDMQSEEDGEPSHSHLQPVSPGLNPRSPWMSPESTSLKSPQSLSFRREREMHAHRFSTSPSRERQKSGRRAGSDTAYTLSPNGAIPRLMRKRSLATDLHSPQPLWSGKSKGATQGTSRNSVTDRLETPVHSP